jgi:hypothetical protein
VQYLKVVQRLSIILVAAGLFLAGGGAHVACAQPDSVRARILEERGFSPDHSPRGALWRSAVVPGWGQFYNRQYLKIPFVYAGFAALGVRIYRSHQEYLLFKRAHLFGRGPQLADEGEPNPYQQYESQFDAAAERLGGERLGAMRDLRDQFRRRRDLAILGAGLLHALNILDAYVSAHLLTFDVGEELSVRVRPTGGLGVAAPEEGPGVRLHVRF